MANLPISGLPTATSLDGTELLAAVQGSSTTKTTSQDIRDINTPLTASSITVGNGGIVPTIPQGATLGTLEKPFSEIFLQSGSISIESDTPGDPSAIISNKGGNLEISVGGMLLVQPGASFVAPTGSFSYLSGSFTHIGSADRVGNTTVTGSFAVSGSTVTIGNNTLEGNTILSGSVNIIGNTTIEGTTTFSDTATTVTGSFLISGSTTQIGNNTLEGNTILSGSVEINGYTPLATASISDTTITFTKVDSSTFDIDLPSAYGSFYDTTTQSGSANTAYAIKHNTTDLSSDVSIVSDTRVTMAEAGVYPIISTQQFQHTSGGTVYITGWLRKNGVDVANSATDLTLKGSGATAIFSVHYFVEAAAGDYFELIWSATDSSTEIVYQAARTSPTRPAVPSVITTVNRVG